MHRKNNQIERTARKLSNNLSTKFMEDGRPSEPKTNHLKHRAEKKNPGPVNSNLLAANGWNCPTKTENVHTTQAVPPQKC